MQELLCQVCGGPADTSDDGVLWLLKDHRDDWSGWPDGMGVTEPPVCLTCVDVSTSACPALRRGYAVIRAKTYPVAGVLGVKPSGPGGPDLVPFGDPRLPWVLALELVRQLGQCTILN
ncbi:hypothetical protein [Actinokineospora terrae]|uniref:Uncharacterized protein n=1 Tax=Actinokineospora terrae TaxID=155974 RepID=A0A1H9S449_9PSEU|nr:hypothetical protein [Actinokineospora terrae]SER79761.1 hypothetical protein SAMN04487818_105263 [Actinokineospora terrae]